MCLCTYLFHILLSADVRRMYQGTHDLYVAMDDQSFVRSIGVDAHSAMVIH